MSTMTHILSHRASSSRFATHPGGHISTQKVACPRFFPTTQKSSHWRVKSSTELEEIDPFTGEIIAGTSMAAAAPSSVDAGGFTIAYRSADVVPDPSGEEKIPVIALHGIGSSSFCYRNLIRLLGAAGHTAIALDWVGHGGSSKPLPSSSFDYSSAAYISALSQSIDALLPDNQPFALIVHGYILGQYGMLYAAQNPEKVAKLCIINTPLGLKSKLRPELAAYKAPLAFLRPKPDAKFDAATFNAAGGPYAMQYKDAMAFAQPYEEDPAASAAIFKTMESVDFPKLLAQVDEEFTTWRNASLVIHGSSDTFLDLKGPLDWLETKRTSIKMASGIEAKIGHMPQEDYPESIAPTILSFLRQK